MAGTIRSKRIVFQTIAEYPDYHWPYYCLPDTEYMAADLGAFEHDVHRLASAWFKRGVMTWTSGSIRDISVTEDSQQALCSLPHSWN